ncbi:Lysophosphatidylcholine acyltransferase 2 [Balamuthia mandrillaris]
MRRRISFKGSVPQLTRQFSCLTQSGRARRMKATRFATVNPFLNFTNETQWTPYLIFKTTVIWLLLIPILRAVLIILLLLFAWVISKLALIGVQKGVHPLAQRPVPLFRKVLLLIIRFCARTFLFLFGFHYIRCKGRPDPSARLLVCNHPSLFEPIWFLWDVPSIPSPVAKKEMGDMPLAGPVLRCLGTILVDRKSPTSRKDTALEIKQRCSLVSSKHDHEQMSKKIKKKKMKKNGEEKMKKKMKVEEDEGAKVLLFPEGTCTNGTCLISFKLGAFSPGEPVQPAVVRYPFKYADITSGQPSLSMGKLFLRALSQFTNYMEVEYLPVYRPSAEEKKHPQLFAHNVREAMAKALNIPTTEHSYEDVVLQMEANKLTGKDMPALVIETNLMKEQFGHDLEDFSRESMLSALKQFVQMDEDGSGEISYAEFLDALNLPDSTYTSNLFHMLDVDESGELNFREFITGMAMLRENAKREEVLKLAFEVFDKDQDGKVKLEDLGFILRTIFPELENKKIEAIFSAIDSDHNGEISFDEFVKYSKQHPEYLQLVLDVLAERRQ